MSREPWDTAEYRAAEAERQRLRTKRLLAVEAALPDESRAALERFTLINRHWRGAHWADCLDVLNDSDSHLEVTESIHEALHNLSHDEQPLVSLVALTLLYAHPHTIPSPQDVRDALPAVLAALGGTDD